MNICEEKLAMPFDVYREFVEKIRLRDGKMHSYLGERGFLIENEEQYKNLVSKVEYTNDVTRDFWDKTAGNLKCVHIAGIDCLCSELDFLSKAVVKEGTVLFGGCGNGDIAEWIKQHTKARLIDFDYSGNMLREYRNHNLDIDCVEVEVGQLPLKDVTVDQILLVGFATNPKYREHLSEAKRVLKRGGEVVMEGICTIDFGLGCNSIDYDDFLRKYMRKMYDNPSMNKTIIAETAGASDDDEIKKPVEFLRSIGMTARHEFSRFPIMPRGTPSYFFFDIPYAVIGRKV